MVKNICIIIILFLLIGCSKQNNILVQNNDLIIYQNYSARTEYPLSLIKNFLYKNKGFDATEQNHNIKVNKQDSTVISEIICNFTSNYFEYEKDNIEKDCSEKKSIQLCGVLNLKDSITSFVILIETPTDEITTNYKVSFSELYLLNYNNDQLRSVVLLSKYSTNLKKMSSINTYLINEEYFSQINYKHSNMAASLEKYIPQFLINEFYNGNNNPSKALNFALFTLDENGYIRKINI